MKKGFTLIELLIVISIIGILASLALVSYSGAQKQARDTTRKSDLAQYRNGITNYAANNNGAYPTFDTGWHAISTGSWLCNELTPDYISSCPADPTNTGDSRYQYQSNESGTEYLLWVEMETGGYWEVCSSGKIGKYESETPPADCDCHVGRVGPSASPPVSPPASPPASPPPTGCIGCIYGGSTCEAGTSNSRCGTGGADCVACGPGEECQSGSCVTSGCAGTPESCGVAPPCFVCYDDGLDCTEEICQGGITCTYPPAPNGTPCNGGAGVCWQANCCLGCTMPLGGCEAGTSNSRCGTGGVMCVDCPSSGQVCVNGSCVSP